MTNDNHRRQPFDLQRMIRDATTSPGRFVCSPQEFNMRYGVITDKDNTEARRYVVLCKDGMIRPR